MEEVKGLKCIFILVEISPTASYYLKFDETNNMIK